MNLDRRFGVAAVIGGVVLLGVAFVFARAPIHEVIHGFTGRYMLGAIGVIVCGGLLAIFGKSR